MSPHSMKRVFLTGGSGFLGGVLIQRLRADGVEVVALARSAGSAAAVEALGAQACRAGLGDTATIAAAMRGCDTVFHVAAHFTEWDTYAAFHQANVAGTESMLQAAREAAVPVFVAAGAAGVVMGRPEPMLGIREDRPLRFPRWAPYTASKAVAEQRVRQADGDGFRTVVVRPPMIWGAGMPMLDEMLPLVEAGRFALPGDGQHLISTAHVRNVAHALVLAARHGRGGEAYFVSDGDDIAFARMVADLLAVRGLAPVERTAPFALAWAAASAMELVWRTLRLRSKQPLTRQMLRMIGQAFTLDDAKARSELGYAPIVRRSEGLEEMHRHARRAADSLR
ncbi:NAD-dependent epimerase/dehydratase family protein [Lysobacter enzymogenes]|uniref:NAD-dependent epimerase/dehydratase family protein n=1 Tax=Lysobacter enzymogenes TaxID=69 RepID=UPI001B8BA983|nr:NAD-dependent epimerase/dehydratase family protein [Lysobacter enzymogenes]